MKLRDLAERLDCLTPVERRVIEGRLGLNGYQQQEQIADQIGMSERHVRRIEKVAIEKLKQAVA